MPDKPPSPQPQAEPAPEPAKPPKKPWKKPELKRYGSLGQITKMVGNMGGSDGGQGNPHKTQP